MSARRAARLPVHRGPAGWAAILPERVPAPPLEGHTTADIAIIGAGFAGLAAAQRLRQLDPTARIALLDAGEIAEGAAGRNSGFMIDLPHELTSHDYAGSGDDRAQIALNRHAIRFASDAVDDHAIPQAFFARSGKINGAASAKAHAANVSYAQHLARLGEASELLDAQAMQDLTGSRHYVSGLYTAGTVMLQPAGFVRGWADGLRHDEVALFERTPVLGFRRDGTGWQVDCGAGNLRAERIILTVNGHLESFGYARGRLMQLFLFAAMTAPLDAEAQARLGGASDWGITPSDPMGTTLRRIGPEQGGDRIVTRTCAALRSDMVATEADLQRAKAVMRAKFDTRFPQLAGFPFQHVWAGHLCLSRNGVAVAKEVERGVFSGCVQNGLGTVRGILTGIAAAEAACGHHSDITLHFAGEADPTTLPPRPIRDPGANAVLRWKEWQARAE